MKKMELSANKVILGVIAPCALLLPNSVLAYPDTIKKSLSTGDAGYIQSDTEILSSLDENMKGLKHQYHNFVNDVYGSKVVDYDVTWYPTANARLYSAMYGTNYPVLLNTDSHLDKEEQGALAVAGTKNTQKYLFLANSPQGSVYKNGVVNDGLWSFYKQSLEWLVGKSDSEIKKQGINITITQHAENTTYWKDGKLLREWLTQEYGDSAHYNEKYYSCNGELLEACITEGTDLLIVSNYLRSGDDHDVIFKQIERANALGIPIIYTNYGQATNDLSAKLNTYYNIIDLGSNENKYYVDAYKPNQPREVFDSTLTSLVGLAERLVNNSFSFTVAECAGGCQQPEYSTEFAHAVSIMKDLTANLDKQHVNIFDSNYTDVYKLMVLLADYYRDSIRYPMSYDSTDNKTFLSALYADSVIHNVGSINNAQPDLGNFSRSDFSHIQPTQRTVSMVHDYYGFRATGAYALPGQTVTIKRLDPFENVGTAIFINTMRAGSTKQFAQNKYIRPKYLRSTSIPIKVGEEVQITNPYGGPIQIEFSGERGFPVELSISNVGEHAYYPGTGDSSDFIDKLYANEFDWAEVSTPQFEVHSRLMNMGITLASPDYPTVEALVDAINLHTTNYAHQFAGFDGDNIEPHDEIGGWAERNGFSLAEYNSIKHMNSDQSSCGSGCAGNPYDANWWFHATRGADSHELGHGLEHKKLRFDGFIGHTSTNFYGNYQRYRLFQESDFIGECENVNRRQETYYGYIQNAFSLEDDEEYMKAQNIGKDWRSGPSIYFQMMAYAQQVGVVEHGLHLYPRLHILLSQYEAAIKSEEKWNERRSNLGFHGFTLQQVKTLSNNDWLAVALARVSGLDYVNYMRMWGLAITPQVEQHIAQFGYDIVPTDRFYKLPDDQACMTKLDVLLPIDGKTFFDGTSPAVGNIAYKKPTTSSSEMKGYPASAVTDGYYKSYYHSEKGSDHWLEIDLETPSLLKTLQVTTRHTHSNKWINGATVSLLDENRQTVWQSDPFNFAELGETLIYDKVDNALPNSKTRYIRVEGSASNLSLAQIEAFDVDINVPSGYEQTLAIAPEKLDFYQALEMCESLGWQLASVADISFWRNLHSAEEHQANGVVLGNYWTNTPRADGKVPYRRFHDATGNSSEPSKLHYSACFMR
ncbi:discoidin domain-containing protein [Vibrio cholerae]